MTDKKRPRTDADYAAASDAWDDGPPADATMRSIEIGPALRMGRPTKGTPAAGKTPTVPVRLPEPIRIEIAHRVQAGQAATTSELIRKAVVEYLERHPA